MPWEFAYFVVVLFCPSRRSITALRSFTLELSNVTYTTDFSLGGPEDWVIRTPPPPYCSVDIAEDRTLTLARYSAYLQSNVSDCAVQCAPISLRTLLCLKVSSLRPLVLLIRVV